MHNARLRILEKLETRLPLDGTAQLVADLNATPKDNQEHAWLGNVLFFAADDGTGNVELWRTDTTTDVTAQVKDIRHGSNGSFPKDFLATENRLFFTAYDDDTGRELWSSDGTIEGTSRVHDIAPGPASGGR